MDQSLLHPSAVKGRLSFTGYAFFCRGRDDMNRSIGLKLDNTALFSIERKVIASTDVEPRMKTIATLPDNNAARSNILPARSLHPKALRIGITTVCGTSLGFCMRHKAYPFAMISLTNSLE